MLTKKEYLHNTAHDSKLLYSCCIVLNGLFEKPKQIHDWSFVIHQVGEKTSHVSGHLVTCYKVGCWKYSDEQYIFSAYYLYVGVGIVFPEMASVFEFNHCSHGISEID